MANKRLDWGTNHPGLLILLVDLSGSMAWDNKIERVGQALFNVTNYLLAPCRDKGMYKNRFHVEVIGYNQYTYEIFSGDVSKLIERLKSVYASKNFFRPGEGTPGGLTHMAMAYEKAGEVIEKWKRDQAAKGQSVPAPIVINITDGFPEETGLSDEEARNKALDAARKVLAMTGSDTNVQLFNLHIDGKPGSAELTFPSARPGDDRRGFLFDASSPMDSETLDLARRRNLPVANGSRFMVSNISDQKKLVELIQFGSSVSMQERRETPLP